MSNYLETTKPSDYDTSGSWHCTIGRREDEVAALGITRYCQAHGDRWQPVPVDALDIWWGHSEDAAEMCDEWLWHLQSVRVRHE